MSLASALQKLFQSPENRRLKRLEQELLDLQEWKYSTDRELKSLRLEWEEAYDKLHHLMARVTKRKKALDRENDAEEPLAPAGDANDEQLALPPSGFVGTHGRLLEARRRHGLLPR